MSFNYHRNRDFGQALGLVCLVIGILFAILKALFT